MTDSQDRHVDVQVLEEVERLLATTSFATIDDLAGRLGGRDDSNLIARASAARRAPGVFEPVLTPPATSPGESSSPLPRRR